MQTLEMEFHDTNEQPGFKTAPQAKQSACFLYIVYLMVLSVSRF